MLLARAPIGDCPGSTTTTLPLGADVTGEPVVGGTRSFFGITAPSLR
jgi:hypothetical protein